MRNKLLIRVALCFFAVLLVFTFMSRSVYKAGLPVVTSVKTEKGSISQTETVTGELYYENAVQASAADAWHIETVYVRNGQTVNADDPLFSVDTAPYEVQRQTYELELMDVEHSLTALDTQKGLSGDDKQYSKQELSAKKKLLLFQMKTLNDSCPPTGKVTAAQSGVVDAVAVKAGDTVTKGQVCVSLHTSDAKVLVRYSLPIESMERFGSINELSVSYKSVYHEKDSEVSLLTTETAVAENTESRLSNDGTKWEFIASLKKTANQPLVHEPADVMLGSHSGTYEDVVPASCVKIGDKGPYVLALSERSSLFGMEYYVKEVDVAIIARNDEQAAIKSKEILQFLDIVSTTTLPLYDNSAVLVQQS